MDWEIIQKCPDFNFHGTFPGNIIRDGIKVRSGAPKAKLRDNCGTSASGNHGIDISKMTLWL
jgi:hypothetical protein